jgi:hypothetical protein
MPKPLAEYRLTEWARLRPAFHAVKTWRYDRVTAAYLRRPPRAGDLAALGRRMGGRRLLVTVAFNDVEILERQLLAVRQFVSSAVHLVADNSRDDVASAQIEALCARLAVAYLRLPANPWGDRSPSRSHGLALNWIWRRLVRPARPELFGFLDHDLVPIARCDPFEPLARQPIHGDKRWAGHRWFLWAGYCFFRTQFLEDTVVDFGQDWFVGLDTGGGNWRSIYAKLDPCSIEERAIERVAILPDAPISDCYVERRGSWLHEVGFDRRPDLKLQKRAKFLALIDAALAEAAAAG